MNNQDIINRIKEIQDKASECVLAWSAANVFTNELKKWREELIKDLVEKENEK